MKFALDEFARRHFDVTRTAQSELSGKLTGCTPELFLEYVNEQASNSCLVDGYAPFCKHVFIPNKYQVLPTSLPLNDLTEPLVETGYKARRDNELPVLCRWIHRDKAVANGFRSPAKFIDVILYSHEQVLKETEAMKGDVSAVPIVDWHIISLKFQDVDHELPMQPITCMRNSLISEGGSGVAINREAYMKSVEFWRQNVELSED